MSANFACPPKDATGALIQSSFWLWVALLVLVLTITWETGMACAEGSSVVRMVYFTANDCPHCAAVVNEVLNPLQAEAGAFVTGVVVSFLELACTGQVYLPTIVFVISQPAMRVRALLFLVLYNLLFILPLVVVFILVYYGTAGSKQLTRFLQQRAATVNLGMALLFAALAAWLAVGIVA